MKKFKYIKPYNGNKTALPETKNRSGVYIIREQITGKSPVIVYVGMSQTNLYKTLYRHFQSWSDKTQIRVSYQSKMKRNVYTVRIVYTTPAQALRLEKALILKHNPRDNDMKYKGYELDQLDQNTLNTYSQIPVLNEVPF